MNPLDSEIIMLAVSALLDTTPDNPGFKILMSDVYQKGGFEHCKKAGDYAIAALEHKLSYIKSLRDARDSIPA